MVIGKGAAYSQADAALRQLVGQAQLPFLATAMGRGVVPDTHAASANAARSLALAQADVAIVFGARWARPVLWPLVGSNNEFAGRVERLGLKVFLSSAQWCTFDDQDLGKHAMTP